MLDLLIINPGAREAIYQGLGDLVACEPPLWTRLIAGYVRDRGFSVRIIDAEAEGWSGARVATEVRLDRPRLICIAVYGHQPSASTQQMVGARAVAEEVRGLAPVIMVGGHVAALSLKTIEEEPIDYACNGEGPATIVGLLLGLPLADIPGLVWWRHEIPTNLPDAVFSRFMVNPAAPLIPIAEMHGNAWDLLPMHRYRAHNWQCFGDLSKRQPYAAVMTSLGCPFKCSFCCINAPFASASAGGNRYRMREPAEVVSEILMLEAEHGVRTVKIVDEMFVLNERHYTEICERLIKAGYGERGGNIWAYARIDTVKPHTLAMLRKAGIRWLALGIESGSAHVRDGSQKALRNDDIVSVVRAIQAAGINVIGNFIFGLPDDTAESMQETLDLALDLKCEFANFYSAMAYPGSALYRDAVENGITLPASWSGYSQHSHDTTPLPTATLTAAEVLKFRDDAFHAYFSDPAYLASVERQFGPETRAHVEAMTAKRLPRQLLAA